MEGVLVSVSVYLGDLKGGLSGVEGLDVDF